MKRTPMLLTIAAVLVCASARGADLAEMRRIAETAALRAVFCDTMGQPSSGHVLHSASRCQLTLADISPPSCLAEVVSGTTVTLALNDCVSSFAPARHAAGTVAATASADVAGIHVATAATGLQIGGATVDLDATATITDAGDVRTWSVSHVSEGANAFGLAVRDQSEYTVQRSARCETLDGLWQQLRDGTRTWSTSISQFSRCGSACPQLGGVIAHTNPADVVVTFTYDGTAILEFTTSNGGSGSVYLICLPN